MRLLDFISRGSVDLDLPGTGRTAALEGLLGLLTLGPELVEEILPLLQRREDLSSTGVGRGIAIPHCRSPHIATIQMAYGRIAKGISWGAIDGQPVEHLFLILAPQGGNGGGYLQLLSKVAQFAKDADTPRRLAALESADEFFGMLEEKGY